MVLDNKTLYSGVQKKKNREFQEYHDIMQDCIKQIKLASKKGFLYCEFRIPSKTIKNGINEINIRRCKQYCKYHLEKMNENIHVYSLNENYLYIKW